MFEEGIRGVISHEISFSENERESSRLHSEDGNINGTSPNILSKEKFFPLSGSHIF